MFVPGKIVKLILVIVQQIGNPDYHKGKMVLINFASCTKHKQLKIFCSNLFLLWVTRIISEWITIIIMIF